MYIYISIHTQTRAYIYIARSDLPRVKGHNPIPEKNERSAFKPLAVLGSQ